MGFPIGHRPNRSAIEGIFKKFQPQPEISAKTCGKNGARRETHSRFPPNFTKTTMARSTVKISAQFKKGVNPHISTQVLGQKYPNLGENGRPGGLQSGAKSPKSCFFHRSTWPTQRYFKKSISGAFLVGNSAPGPSPEHFKTHFSGVCPTERI